MKKLFTLLLSSIAFWSHAQNLSSFTVTLQAKEKAGKNYLGIAQKKSFTLGEAQHNKSAVDLALVISNGWGTPKIEWYNMSGKDGLVPAGMTGTATVINAISFDKEQFTNCKTNQDFKRMTGHISNNAFSHFATVSDDLEKGIAYHCFIIQMENGKRALLWIDAADDNTYTVTVKVQA